MPYVSIILTRIVNYQQLSILYICVTVVSTVGQIILGCPNHRIIYDWNNQNLTIGLTTYMNRFCG